MTKTFYSKFTMLTLLASVVIGCAPKHGDDATESTVHLKGYIMDLGSGQVQMKYNGKLSYIGDSKDLTLYIGTEGYVDTTLTIPTPSYYRIGRNTLYLTPGDSLTIKISPRSEAAEFLGKGAEANNYLKDCVLPKRGSYLNGGQNIRGSFEETQRLIDSLAQARLNTLEALTGVSDEFKELERARIQADVINTYIYYPIYSATYTGPDADKIFAETWKKYTASIAEDMNKRFKEVSTDATYLDVATVREVLKHHKDTMLSRLWFEGLQLPHSVTELYDVAEYTTRLKGQVSEALAQEAQNYLATLKDAELADELQKTIDKSTKLFAGRPAIDIEITDIDGNKKLLSDFKGKLIYVDLWATWCGPCLKEAPAFEALSEKYRGKDIIFVPIGTDTKTEPWLEFLKEHKKELPQYHSTDPALKSGWAVASIPRFLLISKEFEIINAFAPRPSDKAAEELIDTWLDK